MLLGDTKNSNLIEEYYHNSHNPKFYLERWNVIKLVRKFNRIQCKGLPNECGRQ